MLKSKELCKDNPYHLYVDVETSGLSPLRNDTIVAAFILTDISFSVVDRLMIKVRPVSFSHWSKEAEAVHGFTSICCESFQHPFDACIEILKWLAPYKHPQNIPMKFIYHANGPFDWNFINQLFYKQELQYSLYKLVNWKNLLSTIKLCRLAGHKKVSLNAMASHYGIELDHHNASSDVNCCYELHRKLVEIF